MDQPDRDWDLLQRYVLDRCERSFAALVDAHAAMVYAAALRQVRSADLAEEVTQVVFVTLARRAAGLGRGTVVAGWLHRTAVYTARNLARREGRRRHHEARAAVMLSGLIRSAGGRPPAEPGWARVGPLLDDGVARLAAADRQAIVLRFFERRSLAEVGRAMGVSEGAAQMRVGRAVARLRAGFARRGVSLETASVAGLMWSHAARPPAPPSLAGAVVRHVRAVGARPAPVGRLASAAQRMTCWANDRGLAALATAAAVLIVAELIFVIERAVIHGPPASPTGTAAAVVWRDR